MLPTKEKLILMFESLIEIMECQNLFDKDSDTGVTQLKVTLGSLASFKDKDCCLVLYENYNKYLEFKYEHNKGS
ncbi:unnamed protein product [marine sediment metagenome]|uniref:Uncharacterized protein n=1 Tax=marine sediment metagenome TaxID=412755 RepID=X0UT21_9ZZZZ